MINKFFQVIFILAKVLLKSNFFIKIKKSNIQDILVLGNGPSLQQDILNNWEIFTKTELAVVNHFCQSEFFSQLKPKHYFLLDPSFFNQPFIESLEKTHKILTGNVDWEITFYLPWNSRKSNFVQELIKRKNFKIQFINYVTTKGGFRAINHLLYNWNLATPQSQNVLVYSIFVVMRIGVKRIFLFGAENNWHANVIVNKDNWLVLQDIHLYKENKESTEKILRDPTDPSKRITMASLLESNMKAFKGYELLNKYARTKHVQIYNCSKNSLIESFERLDGDEFTKILAL